MDFKLITSVKMFELGDTSVGQGGLGMLAVLGAESVRHDGATEQ